jgi:hypothetical protein
MNTDSCAPEFQFEYNIHEAINMRGKTPLVYFKLTTDYYLNGEPSLADSKPIGFNASCNYARSSA